MTDYKNNLKVFYICDKDNLKSILTSNTICFNLINRPYLFKKIPKHDKNLFVISFKIPQLWLLNKQRKSSDESYYVLKDNLSLELIKNLVIFYKDNKQKEYISNLNKIYFNVKDNNPFVLEKFKDGLNSNISYSELSYLPIDNEVLKYKYEINYDKYDKYKAIIYIFFIHNKNILEYHIKNNKLYKYLNNLLELNELLNKNNNKKLKKYNKTLIDAIENEISNNVTDFFSNNFLYVLDNNMNLSLNRDMFDLNKKDFEFLNIILNGIIFKNLTRDSLLIFLRDTLENFDPLIYEDILHLNERFVKNNYNININSIKNNISQNLYAYLENFDDLISLNTFLKNINIENEFISFMIFGAYTGFKNMTNSLVSKELFMDIDDISIKNNINYIDQYFFKINSNITHIRTKLFYLILLILNNKNLELTEDSFDYASIGIQENTIVISDPYNDLDLYIEYFIPTKKLSVDTYSYFLDKYELALKLGNSQLIENNVFVFSYYFKYKTNLKKSKEELRKRIALDIDAEQDYTYILEYLYNQLK